MGIAYYISIQQRQKLLFFKILFNKIILFEKLNNNYTKLNSKPKINI